MSDKGSSDVSRHIPEPIKKRVRQDCRFGCVICGLPVYHYDHIENFADVLEHVAENIALLCPTHHQDKTSKRLSAKAVKLARASPANSRSDKTSPHRWFFDGPDVVIEVGSSQFTTSLKDGESFVAIQLDGRHLVGFSREDDALLLSMDLRTAPRSPSALRVDRGEITISTAVDDVKLEGPRLSLSPGERSLECVIVKTDSGLKIESGHFFGGIHSIIVDPGSYTVMPMNNRMFGGTFVNCMVGVVIGPLSETTMRNLARRLSNSSSPMALIRRLG